MTTRCEGPAQKRYFANEKAIGAAEVELNTLQAERDRFDGPVDPKLDARVATVQRNLTDLKKAREGLSTMFQSEAAQAMIWSNNPFPGWPCPESQE
jgi:hypothetical protein